MLPDTPIWTGRSRNLRPAQRRSASLLPNTPKNSLNFFTEYRLGGGFEIGGGGQYESARLAQNTPPLRGVPGYWTFDLMGKYDISEKWSLQLNVTNLLDKVYYEQFILSMWCRAQDERALLTLNFRM